MKKFLPVLSLLMSLMMFGSCCMAENTAAVVATVNGEPLYYSDYHAIESAYLYQYESAGVDISNSANYTYVQDLALTYAIEQMLVVQDMTAQGMYELDEEMEAWCVKEGQAAYEQALRDVGEMMRQTLELSAEEDMTEHALSYAAALNVTVDTYIEEFRTQYAAAKYQEWLIRDNPVTDEEVKALYDARVADSEARFAQDVAAFEQAVYTGEEAWYMPAGYRAIQWVMLSADAQGDTSEEKAASVQGKVDAIRSRLASGESFESLCTEFGVEGSKTVTTEQIHPESVVFSDEVHAGAFSEEMKNPGDTAVVVIGSYVMMLYYHDDVPAGPVEYTQEIHDALAYTLYAERTQAAQAARIEELAASAQVELY